MKYEKAFAELIIIAGGDVVTKKSDEHTDFFDSSEEKHIDRGDRGDRKPFPGRH